MLNASLFLSAFLFREALPISSVGLENNLSILLLVLLYTSTTGATSILVLPSRLHIPSETIHTDIVDCRKLL
jgi:hypothetical protein